MHSGIGLIDKDKGIDDNEAVTERYGNLSIISAAE